ncbi:hypothetical protein D9M70_558280 [compost metagenome]
MCKGSGGGAEEIEGEIAEMPERVFDIVAEHPEEQHVHRQMHEVAMQEGIGDEGEAIGNDDQ